MKIISKYKDYYDYLQGIYGIDNKVVLDRRSDIPTYFSNAPYFKGEYDKVSIHICGKAFEIAIDHNDNKYIGQDIVKISKRNRIDTHTNIRWYALMSNIYPRLFTEYRVEPYQSTINEEQFCPIILVCHNNIFKYPKLSDYKIPSVYPAEEIFKDLYTWIESHKIVDKPDNRTDIQKLESKGFDKKTSFRNMK